MNTSYRHRTDVLRDQHFIYDIICVQETGEAFVLKEPICHFCREVWGERGCTTIRMLDEFESLRYQRDEAEAWLEQTATTLSEHAIRSAAYNPHRFEATFSIHIDRFAIQATPFILASGLEKALKYFSELKVDPTTDPMFRPKRVAWVDSETFKP